MKEKFGDVLLLAVLYCKIAERENIFTFCDVVDVLCKKLVRHNTHIFGEIALMKDNDIDAETELRKTVNDKVKSTKIQCKDTKTYCKGK